MKCNIKFKFLNSCDINVYMALFYIKNGGFGQTVQNSGYPMHTRINCVILLKLCTQKETNFSHYLEL